jgi:hypothetical protein
MNKPPLYITPQTTLAELHRLVKAEYPRASTRMVHGELTAHNSYRVSADLLVIMSPDHPSIQRYLTSAALTEQPEHFPNLIIVGEPCISQP